VHVAGEGDGRNRLAVGDRLADPEIDAAGLDDADAARSVNARRAVGTSKCTARSLRLELTRAYPSSCATGRTTLACTSCAYSCTISVPAREPVLVTVTLTGRTPPASTSAGADRSVRVNVV
jgi:hypothetical protein